MVYLSHECNRWMLLERKKRTLTWLLRQIVEAQDIFDKAWEGFKGVDWKEKASVSRFVQANYTPYDGDESFLAGPTERSLHIKKIVEETKAHYEETRFPNGHSSNFYR